MCVDRNVENVENLVRNVEKVMKEGCKAALFAVWRRRVRRTRPS
jgi:hypothetical protein